MAEWRRREGGRPAVGVNFSLAAYMLVYSVIAYS